ncbi:MAG: hypothetical protein ACR2OL_06865 [Anderseniella sp.]
MLIATRKQKEKKMKTDKEQELWLKVMSDQSRRTGSPKLAVIAAVAAVGATTVTLVSGS